MFQQRKTRGKERELEDWRGKRREGKIEEEGGREGGGRGRKREG